MMRIVVLGSGFGGVTVVRHLERLCGRRDGSTITLISRDNFFVITPNYLYNVDTTTWGWVHLGIGVLALVAGFFLFSGATWAKVIGIIMAVVSAVANFFFLPYYPLWSLVIIGMDIFVIWAIAAAPKAGAEADIPEMTYAGGAYAGDTTQGDRWPATNQPGGRHWKPEPAKEGMSPEQQAQAQQDQQQQQPDQQQRNQALADAVKNQQQASEELQRAIDRMNSIGSLQESLAHLRDLLQQQQQVTRDTRQVGQQNIGRTPEQMSQQDRERTNQIAEQQARLAEQTNQAMQQMQQQAQQMKQSDPTAPQAMQRAQQTGQQQQTAQNQQRAGPSGRRVAAGPARSPRRTS